MARMPQVQSHPAQVVNGLTTLIRTCGEPRAEAVVFVHGFLGSSADFVELLADVGEFAYAVALDMPNHGGSERAPGFPCTVQGYADHLAAVIAQLQIERAHLVLHDFGGPWGLAWAADHPNTIASLSMFNVGVLPGYRWHLYARIWRTPLLGELFMASATRTLLGWTINRENPRPFPRAFIDRVFDEMDPPAKRAGLALYRATHDLGALTTQLGARLAPQRLPAFVLWGEADHNLPARYAARQAEYFDVEDLHVLPECGHWPFFDEPAQCSELLCVFLRRQLAREVRSSTPSAADRGPTGSRPRA
jgi:pimeloyl-ACP methyl ester carboxylesterase